MTGAEPADVAAAFRERFGAPAQAVVRAPGRVNLIGEHTDYNEGFVLPMAIDREVRMAVRPRTDGRVVVRALDVGEEAEFEVDAPTKGRGWSEYLKGVAWSLAWAGIELRGFEAAFSGNVPRGSGLSSSAALELAVARAFHVSSSFEWEPERIARICQRAENEWLGVRSGIMDQLASAAGQEGHALLIDCRSLAVDPVPLPSGSAVLVLDTSTRRALVGSDYNERREQCEEAARRLSVASLRELTRERLEAQAHLLTPLLLRRVRHVVAENDRTLAAAAAMRAGDASRLGELMNESHISLRDDFEVSSKALDAMVSCARSQPGCLGARLTGAGFAGCAVALVTAEAASAVAAAVGDCYRTASGREPQIYLCRAAAGAGLI
ncbi:MAG TPA: galactokinase [Trueperaceae bacterium]